MVVSDLTAKRQDGVFVPSLKKIVFMHFENLEIECGMKKANQLGLYLAIGNMPIDYKIGYA